MPGEALIKVGAGSTLLTVADQLASQEAKVVVLIRGRAEWQQYLLIQTLLDGIMVRRPDTRGIDIIPFTAIDIMRID